MFHAASGNTGELEHVGPRDLQFGKYRFKGHTGTHIYFRLEYIFNEARRSCLSACCTREAEERINNKSTVKLR